MYGCHSDRGCSIRVHAACLTQCDALRTRSAQGLLCQPSNQLLAGLIIMQCMNACVRAVLELVPLQQHYSQALPRACCLLASGQQLQLLLLQQRPHLCQLRQVQPGVCASPC